MESRQTEPGSEILVMQAPSSTRLAEGQQPVNREAVKVLALSVGLREAARQTGLSEHRVLKWSQRDPDGPWSVVKSKPQPGKQLGSDAVLSVLKPSEALQNALEEDNRETRISLSRGIRRAAKHIETLPKEALFAGADRVKQTVAAASQVHGWEQKQGESGTQLTVLSIGGEMAIQVLQGS